jgi:hypothetical protein
MAKNRRGGFVVQTKKDWTGVILWDMASLRDPEGL